MCAMNVGIVMPNFTQLMQLKVLKVLWRSLRRFYAIWKKHQVGGRGQISPVGARAKSLKEIGQKLWVGRVQIYKTETWTWQCASFRDLVTWPEVTGSHNFKNMLQKGCPTCYIKFGSAAWRLFSLLPKNLKGEGCINHSPSLLERVNTA